MKIERICGNCCYMMENILGYRYLCCKECIDETVTDPYHKACGYFDPYENPDFCKNTKTENK